jgi:hypothetical protein
VFRTLLPHPAVSHAMQFLVE